MSARGTAVWVSRGSSVEFGAGGVSVGVSTGVSVVEESVAEAGGSEGSRVEDGPGAEVTVSRSVVGAGSVGAGSGSGELVAAGVWPGSVGAGGASGGEVGLTSSNDGAPGVAARSDKARLVLSPTRIHRETRARKDFWVMIIPPDDPRHCDRRARTGRTLDDWAGQVSLTRLRPC